MKEKEKKSFAKKRRNEMCLVKRLIKLVDDIVNGQLNELLSQDDIQF